MDKERKKVALYLPVGREKELISELKELRNFIIGSGWEIHNEYIDEGAVDWDDKRSGLYRLITDAEENKFDILLVWKLDRLVDDLGGLFDIIAKLKKFNIGLVSYKDKTNTLTPDGRKFFDLINSLSGLNRRMSNKRVSKAMSSLIRSGLETARQKGKKFGRPPIPHSVNKRIFELRQKGLSYRRIGKKLNISASAVMKYLKKKAKDENDQLTNY